jgi:ketosteroid isomerase-like protein
VDDHAYAYGHFAGTWQNEAGTKSKVHGKYVNVWRKEAGQWKVNLEIWNSIEK